MGKSMNKNKCCSENMSYKLIGWKSALRRFALCSYAPADGKKYYWYAIETSLRPNSEDQRVLNTTRKSSKKHMKTAHSLLREHFLQTDWWEIIEYKCATTVHDQSALGGWKEVCN